MYPLKYIPTAYSILHTTIAGWAILPIKAHTHFYLPTFCLQYGFVFGVVNLAAFFSALVLGRFGDRLGAKLLYNTGGLLQRLGGIAFGLLEFVEDADAFIGLSYFLR